MSHGRRHDLLPDLIARPFGTASCTLVLHRVVLPVALRVLTTPTITDPLGGKHEAVGVF